MRPVMLLRRITMRMAVRLRPGFTCLTRGMSLRPGMGIQSFDIGHVLAVVVVMFPPPAVMLCTDVALRTAGVTMTVDGLHRGDAHLLSSVVRVRPHVVYLAMTIICAFLLTCRAVLSGSLWAMVLTWPTTV